MDIIIGSVGVEPTKNSKTNVSGKIEKIAVMTPILFHVFRIVMGKYELKSYLDGFCLRFKSLRVMGAGLGVMPSWPCRRD